MEGGAKVFPRAEGRRTWARHSVLDDEVKLEALISDLAAAVEAYRGTLLRDFHDMQAPQ